MDKQAFIQGYKREFYKQAAEPQGYPRAGGKGPGPGKDEVAIGRDETTPDTPKGIRTQARQVMQGLNRNNTVPGNAINKGPAFNSAYPVPDFSTDPKAARMTLMSPATWQALTPEDQGRVAKELRANREQADAEVPEPSPLVPAMPTISNPIKQLLQHAFGR